MHEVKLPQLGQSVEEASIVKWYKNEGEPVKKGELLFSVQTDKAEIECESPADGILRKILVPPDVLVPVMTVVALVGGPDEPLPAANSYTISVPEEKTSANLSSTEVSDKEKEILHEIPEVSELSVEKQFVSPRAKRLAQELKVDVSKIKGSGVTGRVLSEDVQEYAEQHKAIKVTPVAKKLAEQSGVDLLKIKGAGSGKKITKADVLSGAKGKETHETHKIGEIRKPLSPMRRIIAKRMCESMFTAPHYYVTLEVDMFRTSQFRESLGDFRPSYNVLIMHAVAKALIQVPEVNVRWDEDAIVQLSDINLGFAVALPAGLIVPVVKKVQEKSLKELDEEMKILIEKAKSGKLLPDDFLGSTFTVSNLGTYGVDQFTAIINPPNSAILAVGRMKDKPTVINGGIFVRPMMNMTLSSDHRVIDGALAATFMSTLKEILEKAHFE